MYWQCTYESKYRLRTSQQKRSGERKDLFDKPWVDKEGLKPKK